jgi:hypothetical protein
MDYLQLLTPTQKATAQASFAARVRTSFMQANVKVYLLAVDGADSQQAVDVLNSTGLLAREYLVLLPSHLVLHGAAPNPTNISQMTAVQNMLTGSIGIYPVANSVVDAEVWAAWPKNAANWTALLATQAQLANTTHLPPPDPAFISPWAKSAWDGTLFLGKAIATAQTECALVAPFCDGPDVQCLINTIRNTTLNGATGLITLDNNGDRLVEYGVFNLVNRRMVQTGTVDASQGVADIDVSRIIWSDGVSNRLTAPAWGQQPPPSTPAPTAGTVVTTAASGPHCTLYISVVATVILGLVLVTSAYKKYRIVYRKYRSRIEKMRPTDFKIVRPFLARSPRLHPARSQYTSLITPRIVPGRLLPSYKMK